MDQNSWNVAGMQLEVLERSWNIQEWTKNFHSNCIPVHSSSSVIGVVKMQHVIPETRHTYTKVFTPII